MLTTVGVRCGRPAVCHVRVSAAHPDELMALLRVVRTAIHSKCLPRRDHMLLLEWRDELERLTGRAAGPAGRGGRSGVVNPSATSTTSAVTGGSSGGAGAPAASASGRPSAFPAPMGRGTLGAARPTANASTTASRSAARPWSPRRPLDEDGGPPPLTTAAAAAAAAVAAVTAAAAAAVASGAAPWNEAGAGGGGGDADADDGLDDDGHVSKSIADLLGMGDDDDEDDMLAPSVSFEFGAGGLGPFRGIAQCRGCPGDKGENQMTLTEGVGGWLGMGSGTRPPAV
jgi:hypothetical protein